MSSVKHEVVALLERLPEDCSLEDIQYHIYVLGKVRAGLDRADTEGCLTPEEVEARLTSWLTNT
jgi:predicted transcriptional regulator